MISLMNEGTRRTLCRKWCCLCDEERIGRHATEKSRLRNRHKRNRPGYSRNHSRSFLSSHLPSSCCESILHHSHLCSSSLSLVLLWSLGCLRRKLSTCELLNLMALCLPEWRCAADTTLRQRDRNADRGCYTTRV
ncbi:uncharacterized protein BDW43DRAFT_264606 [Aspergillus alliaceus]|uniref:uncharacterized protein n=1 Tax=Petromyces alliaceus TaxID=209559 RepID=UPI0012A66A45|nr:uncharacterized protein BDW43DRAFT_264606 [Aspergillus alliaceus]KAB8237089.1 hypothetical protein BDW43DRAFT_264606 [Aspergillus alliaceus]